MASAWGQAFGAAWGQSWAAGGAAAPIYGTWGESWGAAWGYSWTRSAPTPAPRASEGGGLPLYRFPLPLAARRLQIDDEEIASILAAWLAIIEADK